MTIMDDKIKNIQDAIDIQNNIMMETQHKIGQAEKTIGDNQKAYKKAMEEKIGLQAKLISVLSDKIQDELIETLKSRTK